MKIFQLVKRPVMGLLAVFLLGSLPLLAKEPNVVINETTPHFIEWSHPDLSFFFGGKPCSRPNRIAHTT